MPTQTSSPRAITPISDPIHGRFEFNMFEREFIDSDYFQRLHFVLQNSATYVAFPANKNTRFPHSLGVAHTAGKLFVSGLQNTDSVTLKLYLNDAADLLADLATGLFRPNRPTKESHEGLFEDIKRGHKESIRGFSNFSHRPMFKPKSAKRTSPETNTDARVSNDKISSAEKFGGHKEFSAEFLVDTYWLAIRMYGLMHDVGHLPMSHAFENALKRHSKGEWMGDDGHVARDHFDTLYKRRMGEFANLKHLQSRSHYIDFFAKLLGCEAEQIEGTIWGKDFHEVRSIYIYNSFIANYENSFSDVTLQKYGELVHHLCLTLFFSSSLKTTQGAVANRRHFLFATRQLIDGEIDADRLDYTLRDGHASGSTIGQFDLERLCANSYLLKSSENKFAFGYYVRAVSGIEQFFEQRYQSYKYIVQHRTSQRSNRILETLIAKLFEHAFIYPDGKCADALDAYGYIERRMNGQDDREITAVLPDHPDDIVRVDDANLRTMLFQVRRDLRKRVLATKEARDIKDKTTIHLGVHAALEEELCSLIEIVAMRRFEHAFSVFKKDSFLELLVALAKRGNEKIERSRLKGFITHMLKQDAWKVHEAATQRSFEGFQFEKKPRGVNFVVDLIRPKVFAPEENWCFGEKIWIVRENQEICEVQEMSPILASMKTRIKSDTSARIYVVARNVRNNDGLKKAIMRKLHGQLLKRWLDFGQEDLGDTIDSQPKQE